MNQYGYHKKKTTWQQQQQHLNYSCERSRQSRSRQQHSIDTFKNKHVFHINICTITWFIFWLCEQNLHWSVTLRSYLNCCSTCCLMGVSLCLAGVLLSRVSPLPYHIGSLSFLYLLSTLSKHWCLKLSCQIYRSVFAFGNSFFVSPSIPLWSVMKLWNITEKPWTWFWTKTWNPD